ncbi:MAG: phage portal protein [Pirellulales bacterium]
MEPTILDQFGRPMPLTARQQEAIGNVRLHFQRELRKVRASYDATRDGAAFANHWSNADHRSPNSANCYGVRKKLRSRSRFEVIENNPYLKGMILTVANDFTGSGPKLQLTDKRLADKSRRFIEREYQDYAAAIKYRQKLWRKRLAKCTDGESLKLAYISKKLQQDDIAVPINYLVIECDQCTTEGVMNPKVAAKAAAEPMEVDGIRFDAFEEPIEYFILDQHPGSTLFTSYEGHWWHADRVTHWYRRDRAWLRGIPETTPSLPLCALLRRFTLAVVKAAEWAAANTGVLESEMPPSAKQFTDSENDDDAFDTFPIEHGMFNVLPWGTKLSQLEAKQPVATYDTFVNALLREIARPILVPFNFASGSSKESNMASAVVDSHIYKEGGRLERLHCQEEVCDPDFARWFRWAQLVPGYLYRDAQMLPGVPRHEWHWDRIGLDHTDPSRVAAAVKDWHEGGHLTDRDIQETYFNRDVDDWRDEVEAQIKWRKKVGIPMGGPEPKPPAGKVPPKKKPAADDDPVEAAAGNNGHSRIAGFAQK